MEIEIRTLFQQKIITLEGDKIIVDAEKLIERDPKIHDILLDKPAEFIDSLKKEARNYSETEYQIKLINFNQQIDISKIRVSDLGKLFQIDGIVNKITDPMAMVRSKTYECPSCGTTINSSKNIKNCSCGRKGGLNEIDVELCDFRELIIEELQEKTAGKKPQKMRIRLIDKLAGEEYSEMLKAGSRVSIIGIVDKIPLNGKLDEEVYEYRIVGVHIASLEEEFDDTVTEEDENIINEISLDKPLEKLTSSLAPEIFGNEELKKLLILQMAGGVRKELFGGKFTRDWSNILIVGEPSVGKSQLAKNVNLRMPRSIYSSGDASSGVGITAAVVKDDLLGNWGISVGPVVKASGSLAIIDELDKFPKNELKSLHTPMELGFVKVDKAGLDSTFPAETAILALANPKQGIFDSKKSLVDQIDLAPALLSRFDIIYILKDEINKVRDDEIVNSIYSKNSNQFLIDIRLFRKYISYARKMRPTLGEEHLEDLKEFYHDVRKKSTSEHSDMRGMQIGTRHLQGVIRLAEASAKIRLSEKVEKEDISLAKKLFYNSLVKIGMDDTGTIDLARMGSGKTISQKQLASLVLDKIRQICSEKQIAPDSEVRSVMYDMGMSSEDYYKAIDLLNSSGSILKQGNGWTPF